MELANYIRERRRDKDLLIMKLGLPPTNPLYRVALLLEPLIEKTHWSVYHNAYLLC